jgi:hypothetical protein
MIATIGGTQQRRSTDRDRISGGARISSGGARAQRKLDDGY